MHEAPVLLYSKIPCAPRLLVDKLALIPYKTISSTVPLSGRNSAVECQLPKLDVTGSIPVARSKISFVKSPLKQHVFALLADRR